MSKFEQLIDKIRKSRDKACQLQEELERKLSDHQSDITFAQEKVSHELAQEMSKSAYQFRHKGHERQFNFNASVQESLETAKSKLAKMVRTSGRKRKGSTEESYGFRGRRCQSFSN